MKNTEKRTVEMALILLLTLVFWSTAVSAEVTWTRKSSSTRDMPAPSDGEQQTWCDRGQSQLLREKFARSKGRR